MPEKRTTIILVRHGECSANIEERFRGRIDFELNELGLRQAEEIASALVRLQPAALYSSPLCRAVQSLEPTAAKLGLDISLEGDLTNISFGPWEGRKKSEIAREQPELWHLWKTNPEELSFTGMESLDEVGRRSRAGSDRGQSGFSRQLLKPFCFELREYRLESGTDRRKRPEREESDDRFVTRSAGVLASLSIQPCQISLA